MSTGKTNAIDMNPKASNKCARLMEVSILACHREKGSRSMRAAISSARASDGSIASAFPGLRPGSIPSIRAALNGVTLAPISAVMA